MRRDKYRAAIGRGARAMGLALGVVAAGTEGQTALYRINAGGSAFTDGQGRVWQADQYFNTGNQYGNGNAIAGTTDDALYQSTRWDGGPAPEMMYAMPAASGQYQVRLHFAEIYFGSNGARVFDVKIEGQLVLDDLDIHAQAGANAALVKEFTVGVSDGTLNVEFLHGVENPMISAMEVLSVTAPPPPPPAAIRINAGGPAFTDGLGRVWEADRSFNTGNTYGTGSAIANSTDDALYQTERWDGEGAPELAYAFPVAAGNYTVRLHFAEIAFGTGGARVFDVKAEGALVLDDLDICAQAGPNAALVKEIPVTVSDGTLNLEFLHVVQNPKVSALEIIPASLPPGHDDPYLHVVIGVDPYTVDHDQDGTHAVSLDGTGSHTHEPGRKLIAHQWTKNGVAVSDASKVDLDLPVGTHAVTLTIKDDGTPQRSLSGSSTFQVVEAGKVPGALVRAYLAGTANPLTLLDQVPAKADHAKAQAGLSLTSQEAGITAPGMTRFQATLALPTSGTYQFQATGGQDKRLFVNGSPVTGSLFLTAGTATVEARFAHSGSSHFPLAVTYGLNGGAQTAIPTAWITHSEIALPPVANAITPEGPEAGGNAVILTGMGFFPPGSVTVLWGSTPISGSALTVKPASVQFNAPSGVGTVQVSLQTPNGTSKAIKYLYQPGQLPVQFALSNLAAVNQPTQAAWGPDGRLYVAGLDGRITVFTLDDNYNVTATQVITTIANLGNPQILGIAFNPREAAGPVRIYVGHGKLYANGGSCFAGAAPYPGQVSVLTGPGFGTVQPLITGLPVSNHDHAVNGLEFDQAGDLWIAVGGNTNAGVEHCNLGDLPASPLTAAILKAQITKSGFNGQVKYVLTGNGQENMDAVFGDQVDVKAGVDVTVWAAGLRNPFDLTLATSGRLYATDNGPNQGYGAASTSVTTQTSDPYDQDELNLIEPGAYYGHPNRNRGRWDARQNVYRGSSEASIPGVFTQALASFPPSTDGIVEYRSLAFGGAMWRNLILQKLGSATYRAALNAEGTAVTSSQVLFASGFQGLDVTTAPGGVLIGTGYDQGQVLLAKPTQAGSGFVPFDIHPWRAPASGGAPFEIGGIGFGTLANTTVTVGGVAAQLISVSATRIKGTLPAHANPPATLVDVDVKVGTVTKTLPGAFRFLAP